GELYTTLSLSPPFGYLIRVTPENGSWRTSNVYTFQASASDGGAPFSGLISDEVGNFYGTTVNGGPNGGGTVFRVSRSKSGPKETILHYFTGGDDGSYPVASLVQRNGVLYGTAEMGGPFKSGIVFSLT